MDYQQPQTKLTLTCTVILPVTVFIWMQNVLQQSILANNFKLLHMLRKTVNCESTAQSAVS